MFNLKLLLIWFVATAANGSFIFNCQFSTSDQWHVGDVYTCQPQVNFVGTGNAVTNVLGTHTLGKTNSQVKCLYINDQNINTLPDNINNFFPNLIVLDVSRSHLQTITADSLKPFPNLLAFVSSINNVYSIDGDLFKYTPKLRYLAMHYTGLKQVGNGLLDGLNDLTRTDFEGNICINKSSLNPVELQQVKQDLESNCNTSECPASCLSLIQSLETQAIAQADFISQIIAKNIEQDDKIDTLECKMETLT